MPPAWGSLVSEDGGGLWESGRWPGGGKGEGGRGGRGKTVGDTGDRLLRPSATESVLSLISV